MEKPFKIVVKALSSYNNVKRYYTNMVLQSADQEIKRLSSGLCNSPDRTPGKKKKKKVPKRFKEQRSLRSFEDTDKKAHMIVWTAGVVKWPGRWRISGGGINMETFQPVWALFSAMMSSEIFLAAAKGDVEASVARGPGQQPSLTLKLTFEELRKEKKNIK